VPLAVGDIVCVHGEGSAASCWIGEVCDVVRMVTRYVRVKQLGYQQITSFAFHVDELRETVMTFEGPMCCVCKVPY
jgi:hypothetical protein